METLSVKERKLKGRKTNLLRNKKIIPAVVYGHGFDSIPLEVLYIDFLKVYKQAGESSLISLEIKNKKPVKGLIYKVDRHPITDKIIHVDFYKIKAGEKITVDVVLKFIGTSPAIKDLGGTLMTPLNKVEIECLPEDLINEIEVDISSLKAFGDAIRVKDLSVSVRVKIAQDREAVVVLVEAPQKTEEEKPEEVLAEEGAGKTGKKEAAVEGEGTGSTPSGRKEKKG